MQDGFTLSGGIALVQACLYLLAWLMGRGFVWKFKKGLRVLVTIVAFALIIPYLMFLGKSDKPAEKPKAEEISWADIEMRELLPELEKLYGHVVSNSETALNLTLCDITEKDFRTYRDQCMEAGYLIGTLCFPVYLVFGLPITILGFIGAGKQKKLNRASVQ